MCLTTRSIYSSVLDRDFVVFKVLANDNHSPIYGHYEYRYGRNYPTRKQIPADIRLDESTIHPRYTIEGGFLHAYVTEQAAYGLVTQLQGTLGNHYKVVEMVIPKGTVYWAGIEDDVCAPFLDWRKPSIFERLFGFKKR